jgi:hypothetical protein
MAIHADIPGLWQNAEIPTQTEVFHVRTSSKKMLPITLLLQTPILYK